MGLSIYTYQSTKLPSIELQDGQDSYNLPENFIPGLGSQKGRRAIQAAFVVAGVVLATIGILGLYGQLPICVYTSTACLYAGGLLLIDGLIATLIDVVRSFKRPTFKLTNTYEDCKFYKTSWKVSINGKSKSGVCVRYVTKDFSPRLHFRATQEVQEEYFDDMSYTSYRHSRFVHPTPDALRGTPHSTTFSLNEN